MYLYYISYVVPIAVLLPLVIAGHKFSLLASPLRIVVYYLVLSATVNFSAIILAESGHNNLPLLHLFTLTEGELLLFFYMKCPGRLPKRFFIILMTGFALFCVCNSFFIQDIFGFNTYARFAEALMIVSCTLYSFYITLDTKDAAPWPNNPLFWINSGLLLYFSSSLFLFFFSEVLRSNRSLNIIAWVIHATMVLVMYILFSFAFLQHRRPALQASITG